MSTTAPAGVQTIDSLAAAKMFDLDFLEQNAVSGTMAGVAFDYLDYDGAPLYRKIRIKVEGQKNRFTVPPGTKLASYGRWRLADNKTGQLFITEGETDALTLWHHGYPALGIPGASSTGCLCHEDLAGLDEISTIFIAPDNDDAGARFAEDAVSRIRKLGFAGRVCVVRLPEGIKDLNELHVQDSEGFKDALNMMMAESVKACLLKDGKPRQAEWTPFPVEVLPKCMGMFIETVAKSMMIEASLVALPALSALASAIGNSRRIRIKNGWAEPSIIWTTVIALSGSTKSPPFDAVMQPLREWMDCDKGITLTTDATIEAINKVLSENPRGIILARNELSAWFGSFGQYKSGPLSDVGTWLELQEGRSSYSHRIGSGFTKIPRSSVSVSGTIQPSTLATILKPQYRENGLLARFLLAAPPEKDQCWTEDDIPESVSQEWRDLVWSLLAITDEKELILSTDQEAKNMWVDFYNLYKTERKALPAAATDMKAAYPKLIAYAARIALVLQMVRYAAEGGRADIIEAESMAAAIKLAEWFKNETMQVYGLLDDAKNQSQNESLLQFIKRQGGKVSARDVQRNYRPLRNTKSEDIEKTLMELAKDGHGTVNQEGKSTVFII